MSNVNIFKKLEFIDSRLVIIEKQLLRDNPLFFVRFKRFQFSNGFYYRTDPNTPIVGEIKIVPIFFSQTINKELIFDIYLNEQMLLEFNIETLCNFIRDKALQIMRTADFIKVNGR